MYQAQSDQIAKDVPAEGHAENIAVELFRCAQNVYYEIYNNGGGNMGSLGGHVEYIQHVAYFRLSGFNASSGGERPGRLWNNPRSKNGS